MGHVIVLKVTNRLFSSYVSGGKLIPESNFRTFGVKMFLFAVQIECKSS